MPAIPLPLRVLIHTTLLSLLPTATASAQEDASASKAGDPLTVALSRSASDSRVVLLAVTMPFARGSRELEAHLTDKRLRKLRDATEVVRYEQRVDGTSETAKALAARYLQGKHHDFLAAPQVIFLRGDGEVLVAAPGRLTLGQLEWLWVDALSQVRPKFAWEASPAARAPATVGTGKPFVWHQKQAPSSQAEMATLLAAAEKASTIMQLHRQGLPLACSPDPIARRAYAGTLGLCDDASRIGFLQRIAIYSPSDWYPVVVPWLKRGSDASRRQAAVTLEVLAAKGATAQLRAGLRKQKNPAVKRAILRALAASSPDQSATAAAILRVVKARRSDEVDRVHALLAAIPLENRSQLEKIAAVGLADSSARVRATTAYVLASRGERGSRAVLEKSSETEEDPEAKKWIQTALRILAGDETMAAFAAFRKVLEETS